MAKSINVCCILILCFLFSGCSNAYYEFMEKFGVHKRDILIDRVEDTQTAQNQAEKEFKSALEQFGSVVTIENTNLKKMYEELNAEYEDCQASALVVLNKIKQIESVSNALFREWKKETVMYQNDTFREQSNRQLVETYQKYEEMILLMKQSVNSMATVLYILQDNVLFLKHNLNAQAIGSLQSEFSNLNLEVDELIQRVQVSIDTSDAFIKEMRGRN